jgi:hypothetical protein
MGKWGDIIVPAIPALDFGPADEGAANAASCTKLSTWPEFMRTPLIKVGKNIPEGMLREFPGGPEKAFASGVRSCTMKVDGQWYRLKGCGNNDEGFLVKSEMTREMELTRQIRGSAWEHTALRENFMAAHLASSMQPRGMLGANEAFGVYMYDAPNQPFGPDVSVPACIVTKTLGDRRLGTHVMSGIEAILPLLLDVSRLEEDQLSSFFTESRRGLNCPKEDIVVTTAALMTDHMMALEFIAQGAMEPGTHGLEFDVPRDTTVLTDGMTVPLPHKQMEEGVYPQQWTQDGAKDMGSEWQPMWDKCVKEYNSAVERLGDRCVLAYLFSRLGNDAGRIMRGMHEASVSWGTYQDEICVDASQWHCNAHANNLVVLAEGSSDEMFLGYLDLDMAFDDETFVSVYGKAGAVGTVGIGQDDHATLLKREHVNFLEVLCGADSNTGVPPVLQSFIRQRPKAREVAGTMSLLYDSLALGYLNAYSGPSFPVAPFDPDLHRLSHIIIKFAIIVMADCIA